MARNGKFNAKRVKADGYSFDSQVEHARYCDLKMLQVGKQICGLLVHPIFTLDVNGAHIANYVADFSYRIAIAPDDAYARPSRLVVEDVKGFATPEYKIKRELFKALYPDADFRELNTDKSSERKAWSKFAASRIQTQGTK